MGIKTINKKINILAVPFLSIAILSIAAANSYAFLTDEIAASVGSTPVTLNELYFLYNFNMINNLKYSKIGKTITMGELRHILNIYINRTVILKQEEKTGGVTISAKQVNSLISSFKKKYEIMHKKTGFKLFLSKFGLNEASFYNAARNILIEKSFIKERLSFFLFTMENTGKNNRGYEQKHNKELAVKLKNLLLRLKEKSKIKINGGFN
jgi:hypothetical protein